MAARKPLVIYTAAHGGFLKEKVPLGGGAAVYEHLIAEWARTNPFPLKTITPEILGGNAPEGSDLVRFGEQDYAGFSFAFEEASTAEILKHDPETTVVLANDISEGPDFEALGKLGYRIATIFHVDVVNYVTDIYLKRWVAPETTVRWERRLRWALPKITRLIWAKQEACVRHSRKLIVPSAGMREVIRRCYPECPAGNVEVLPWGAISAESDSGSTELPDLRREFSIPQDALVLLTLSRISPEKGQDLLLEQLAAWERRTDYPARPLWVFLCGEAAFMQGQRYLDRLKQLAAQLKKTKVVFPGYVTGARKQAFFALADLYVFPSRHESYGLTLMEALAAGVPAVSLDHPGGRAVFGAARREMNMEIGRIVPPDGLLGAINELLSDDDLRQQLSRNAQKYAAQASFENSAARLAEILVHA